MGAERHGLRLGASERQRAERKISASKRWMLPGIRTAPKKIHSAAESPSMNGGKIFFHGERTAMDNKCVHGWRLERSAGGDKHWWRKIQGEDSDGRRRKILTPARIGSTGSFFYYFFLLFF
jgi:hypothetical protein